MIRPKGKLFIEKKKLSKTLVEPSQPMEGDAIAVVVKNRIQVPHSKEFSLDHQGNKTIPNIYQGIMTTFTRRKRLLHKNPKYYPLKRGKMQESLRE